MGSRPVAVDIVTVTFNSGAHVDAYLAGLGRLDYPSQLLRLIVVDNASADDTVARLSGGLGALPFPATLRRGPLNLGFGAACNLGAEGSRADFLLFLNPDAVLAPDAVSRMVATAVAGPDIGLLEPAHEPVPIPKRVDPVSGNTDWCSGAALLANRVAFQQLRGFDPFFFLYAEDVDLSWRMLLAGWRCVQVSGALVRHVRAAGDGAPKPIEVRYSVRYSFAMRFIYGTVRGLAHHVVRGLRYLVSPRTSEPTRRGVAEGLGTLLFGLPHLIRRRRWAQRRISPQPPEWLAFTEWYYGRWDPPGSLKATRR